MPKNIMSHDKSLKIFHIDAPIVVDEDAYTMLPNDTRAFIRDTLYFKYGIINGFGWCNIKMYNATCVSLCTNGSPSHDVMYIWVFDTNTSTYDLYYSPYPLRDSDDMYRANKDSMGPIMSVLSFDDLIQHIRVLNVNKMNEIFNVYFANTNQCNMLA